KKEREEMKEFSGHRFARVSRAMIAVALLGGLVGCQAVPGGGALSAAKALVSNPVPIKLSAQCMSWDAGKELIAASSEEPTVESALDRVNTAARIIEIGDLIITTLPISAGADWPKKVSGSVSLSEGVALQQQLQQDPGYNTRTAG